MERKPLNAEKYYKVIDIYAHGTGRQILAQNWVEWKRELPTQGFTIYAVALFLLGCGCGEPESYSGLANTGRC
jgi:hypothetical protein